MPRGAKLLAFGDSGFFLDLPSFSSVVVRKPAFPLKDFFKKKFSRLQLGGKRPPSVLTNEHDACRIIFAVRLLSHHGVQRAVLWCLFATAQNSGFHTIANLTSTRPCSKPWTGTLRVRPLRTVHAGVNFSAFLFCGRERFHPQLLYRIEKNPSFSALNFMSLESF